jgi:hypothetical protein
MLHEESSKNSRALLGMTSSARLNSNYQSTYQLLLTDQKERKGKVGDMLLKGDNSATLIGFGLQSEENFEHSAFNFGA